MYAFCYYYIYRQYIINKKCTKRRIELFYSVFLCSGGDNSARRLML